MDRRETMALSGSSSYYIQQRGITGSGSGSQSGLHGSPGLHSLSNPNLQYHPGINASSIGSMLPVEPSSAISSHRNLSAPSAVPGGETPKRKRGRPRKYGPDGTVSLALTSSPATHPRAVAPNQKRGRGRPPGTGRKQQLASLGEWLSGSAGMSFTPHVITIEIGEDIAAKIMAFSQQGPRAVCILSANGAVSTVTLSQSSSSGGTVTFEGRFEIICLSGSYLPANSGGSRNRTGGLSVSLASPDGRVIGGGVGGMLIAASPVQVIVGSFIWGGSRLKNKKGESQVLKDSDDLLTPTSITPSQNLSASPTSVWPGARSMDMRNTHVDIDLMRG